MTGLLSGRQQQQLRQQQLLVSRCPQDRPGPPFPLTSRPAAAAPPVGVGVDPPEAFGKQEDPVEEDLGGPSSREEEDLLVEEEGGALGGGDYQEPGGPGGKATMARNEEKMLGKLNRLWLQKEKDEGRLKEIRQNRPKLSSLNSAIDVKKWIPSIKSEIEYYLQQLQLSHYSERKIQEFENHIEELQKEYRCYLWKLRHLDPSHKEHPWKPRAYTRKRPATINQQASLQSFKQPCMPQSNEVEVVTHENDIEESDEGSEKLHLSPRIADGVIYDCSVVNPDFQDKPLTFNSARNPPRFSMHLTSQNTMGEPAHHMTKILLSRLPNLQTSSSCGTATELHRDEEQMQTGKIVNNSRESILQTETSGILGLSCYSSDEDI